MSDVRPVENLYAAAWKSAVDETLATLRPDDAAVAAIVAGTARYCDALSAGQSIPRPAPVEGPLRDSDPEIAAYLAQLHHRQMHDRCTVNDAQVQQDIATELKRFTYGNPLWQQMSQQYFANYATYPFHTAKPPAYRSWTTYGDPDFGVITWRLPVNAIVALVGDIGTGTDIAAATLTAALAFAPDAILHVGDVYFSGTRFEMQHRLINLVQATMAAAGHVVPFFTVPGNHEYFAGNYPYFECLDSAVLTPLPEQRQRASYFSLRTADDGWQFLGMDTGYYGHYLAVNDDQQRAALAILHGLDPRVPVTLPIQKLPPNTDMVLLRDDELQWHRRQIDKFRGQSILLSHHPLYSQTVPCGIAQRLAADGAPDPTDVNRAGVDTALWRQLGATFGDKVPAWFWGHEHNLAIYQNHYRPKDWPDDPDTRKIFKALPFGRCIGHSAIPVAESEAPYAEHFQVPLQPGTKLGITAGWYNHGFEIFRIAGAGKPIVASYYQVVGVDPKPLLVHEETIGGRAHAVIGGNMSGPAIYRLSDANKAGDLDATRVWSGDGLAPGLTNFVQFPFQDGALLLGQQPDGTLQSYKLTSAAPYVTPVPSRLNLGSPCDILKAFMIGGQQHLLAYRAEKGTLAFHRVHDDLTLSQPFSYYRLRSPGLTTGWTMLEPITYLGMVYYAAYDAKTGSVELFNVNVTANGNGDTPPLQTLNVWSWTWAHGWKHFAFFQLGGENFFFKINVDTPNVNIDHLCLDPSLRSNEVCTQKGDLMPDNQDASLIVRALTMAKGAPYLLTYLPGSGKTTCFSIDADCQGWTSETQLNTVTGAKDIVTYRVGRDSFALFY